MNKSIILTAAAILVAVARVAAAQDAVRIEAVSRGSSIVAEDGKGWDEEVALATNNDGDRVGADYSVCDPATEHSADSAPTCGYASFYFPQLTVSGKSVLLNGEVIANIKKGFFSSHVKLVKGYTLKAVKTPATVDGGFDRSRVTNITVYIEKTN